MEVSFVVPGHSPCRLRLICQRLIAAGSLSLLFAVETSEPLFSRKEWILKWSCGRAKINEVLLEQRGIALTVCFKKKPKDNDVADALAVGQGDLSQRAWRKKVKDLRAGEERVMVGHHAGSLDEHQRLKFTETGVGQRLVDTRTTQWVIVDRTKYIVKK